MKPVPRIHPFTHPAIRINKDQLIDSASALHQPSAKTVEEFTAKAEGMAKTINDTFARRPDLDLLIGPGNLDMMCENHRNHMRFMSSLFLYYEPRVLVETVLWVFRAYRNHGFNLTYWPAQLDNWLSIFRNEMSTEAHAEIEPFYHWMIVNNPAFALLSENQQSDVVPDGHSLAR